MEPTAEQYDKRTEAILELSRGMNAMLTDVTSLRSELQTSLVQPAAAQVEDRKRSSEDRRLLRRIWHAASGVYLPLLLVLGMAIWAGVSVHQIRGFVSDARADASANRLCAEPSEPAGEDTDGNGVPGERHECYERRVQETAERLADELEDP